jgi:protein-disulfide isomerase
MRTRILAAGLLLLISAGWLAAQNAANAAATNLGPDRTACLGDREAPVVIEVFSDFQCPSCQQFFFGIAQPLLRDYVSAGMVCLIYRELPLERIHAHARQAALYSVAAGRIGRWMQVTTILYATQNEWSKDGSIEAVLARELPPDVMSQLRRQLRDTKLRTAIEHDVARARQLGVSATPTWFLTANGKTERQSGVPQYVILRRYLDHLLNR